MILYELVNSLDKTINICYSLKMCVKDKKRQQYNQKWAKLNPEKKKQSNINWNKKNPHYHALYAKKRKKLDLNFKLRCILRDRFRKAIKNETKTGSAIRDLGCTIPELKQHLESKFQPGMTWDNYGEWHIDHIKPLAKFDLTILDHIKEACHFSNLQPLWANENISKGKK